MFLYMPLKQNSDGGKRDLDQETQSWIKWASDQADRLDPLKENPPSILDKGRPYKSDFGLSEKRRSWGW